MQPSQWTSTYNNQFRDRRNYISPHSQQPMHHYADQYDPSHWVKTQGYYGTRAALSEHAARTAELQARGQDMQGGQTYRVSQPLAHTQATYASGSMTARSAPLPRMSQSGPITYTHGFSSGRDLWNTPTKPHSGVYSDHVNIGVGSGQGFRTLSFAPHVTTLNHTQKSSGVDYWSKQSGEFDANHSSVPGVSLYRDTTPRNKYHLPGYAGFVRGRQFLHGDTYGKTTRSCLDVPVDVPLEP